MVSIVSGFGKTDVCALGDGSNGLTPDATADDRETKMARGTGHAVEDGETCGHGVANEDDDDGLPKVESRGDER